MLYCVIILSSLILSIMTTGIVCVWGCNGAWSMSVFTSPEVGLTITRKNVKKGIKKDAILLYSEQKHHFLKTKMLSDISYSRVRLMM